MLGHFKTANNVRCALHTAISPTDLSIVVDAATSPYNNFPDPFNDEPSDSTGIATLTDSITSPTKVEIITYQSLTNNGNGTYTLGSVNRAREGTTAQAFSSGAIVMQAMTAGMLSHPDITISETASTIDINFDSTSVKSLKVANSEIHLGLWVTSISTNGSLLLPDSQWSLTRILNISPSGPGISVYGLGNDVTGVPPVYGQRLTLINIAGGGAYDISLLHNSSLNPSGGRFTCPGNSTFTLRYGGAVDIVKRIDGMLQIIAP